jgi:hypothetical protein
MGAYSAIKRNEALKHTTNENFTLIERSQTKTDIMLILFT